MKFVERIGIGWVREDRLLQRLGSIGEATLIDELERPVNSRHSAPTTGLSRVCSAKVVEKPRELKAGELLGELIAKTWTLLAERHARH